MLNRGLQEFLALLGSWHDEIEPHPSHPICEARALDFILMTHDATALLNDALRLPENERMELASRLLAQENSVISAEAGVMSGAPVFKGTRVLLQTLMNILRQATPSTTSSKVSVS